MNKIFILEDYQSKIKHKSKPEDNYDVHLACTFNDMTKIKDPKTPHSSDFFRSKTYFKI